MIWKHKSVIAVVGFLLTSSATTSNAQSTPRESLRGLAAIPVNVWVAKGAGTTPDRLLEFIELRLRRSGITVPADNARSLRDGQATLRVSVLSSDDGASLMKVEVRLTQDVTLNRRPTIKMHVATWEQSMSGGDLRSNEPNIQRWVTDLLDSFINDYLAVNQK